MDKHPIKDDMQALPSKRAKRSSAVQLPPTKSVSQRVQVQVDDEFVDEVVALVKQERGTALTMQERLDILLLQVKLRQEKAERQKKIGSGRKLASYDVSKRVAWLLNRKEVLVREVWKNYVQQRQVTVAKPPGNASTRPTRVPMTNEVTTLVQQFVRERRITRTRTLAKDVMAHLDEQGHMAVDRSSNTSLRSALRSVQRFLQRKGFKRGHRKGALSYRLREENQHKRDEYAYRMVVDQPTQRRRKIYLDESYIHHRYKRHDDSLYDPNDEQDLQVQEKHKGQRYCFIAAILDADPTVPEEKRDESQKAQLMQATLDIFKGGKQTKDYHGMFNHEYFVSWMSKLLNDLKQRKITNAIIVMDNARYHKKKPHSTPRSSSKKAILQAACEEYRIPYDAHESKAMLWNKLSRQVDAHVRPVICQMAETEGHEVVFSPPHHSDLQPIELIWAIVKGEVGRLYTTSTTFAEVRQRLEAAFSRVSSHTVQGCINKANKHLHDLWQQVRKLDHVDEQDDDDDDDPDTSEVKDEHQAEQSGSDLDTSEDDDD